jgi:hypothetical protein
MRSPSIACRALVLVVFGATSLGLASCSGGGEAKTVTLLKTVPTLTKPPSRRHRETPPPPTAPPTARAPTVYSSYSASLYDAEVPRGWDALEDESSHGEFVRSKWRNPSDPNTSVLVDAVAGENTPAEEKAASIRAATSSSPGYSELSFAPTTVAGLAGAKWVFQIRGDRRVDYFANKCSTGIAVLGSTSPSRFSSLEATFAHVADSISFTCNADGSYRGPTGCDPNYKGACLDPNASDYDCEGGSGDGPKYVAGPVTVVGDDHFELDRDGDGTACE